MFPDADAPGERLFMQLKEVLPNLEHHHLPKGFKDYGDYFSRVSPVFLPSSDARKWGETAGQKHF